MLFTLLFVAVSASGHWEGKIHMKQDIAVTVDLAQNAKGVWAGTLSIPSSGAIDVPLTWIAVDDRRVRFTVNLPGKTSFEATPDADGSLTGEASNPEGSVPFEMKRTGDANVKLPPPSSALTKEFAGNWEASISDRTVKLKVEAAADGLATATFVSRGQEIPSTSVWIKGKELTIEARSISGTFQGTLNDAGEIAGEIKERSGPRPVTFKRPPSN